MKIVLKWNGKVHSVDNGVNARKNPIPTKRILGKVILLPEKRTGSQKKEWYKKPKKKCGSLSWNEI